MRKLYLITLCILYSLPSLLHAEEGMFLPDQIPYTTINQKYHVDLTPEKVAKITRSVVQIFTGDGAGSGSFISPDGLILTNHHVAFDCIQYLRGQGKIQDPMKKDFASDFFFAKNYDQELPCETYMLQITRSIEDVTQTVVAALLTAKNHEEKKAALSRITKKLISACEGLDPNVSDDIFDQTQNTASTICKLSSLNSIQKYFLEKRDVIRDVRLVYAPSKNMASLGGDNLNFQYPRMSTDFAFLRAYGNKTRQLDVGLTLSTGIVTETQDDKDNTEYRFLASSENLPLDSSEFYLVPELVQSVQPTDFVMIMGYPGITTRVRCHFSIDHRICQHHPFEIGIYSAMEKVTSERLDAIDKSLTINTLNLNAPPNVEIRHVLETEQRELLAEQAMLQNKLAGISNSLLNVKGTLEGLLRAKVLDKKIALDDKLEKAIAANEVHCQKYGALLPTLQNIYTTINQCNPPYAWLSPLTRTGIFSIPARIVQIKKTLEEKKDKLTEAETLKLLKQEMQTWNTVTLSPVAISESIAILEAALTTTTKCPIPALTQWVESLPNTDPTSTPNATASRLITSLLEQTSFYRDATFQKSLMPLSYSEFAKSEDPLIALTVTFLNQLDVNRGQLVTSLNRVLETRTAYFEALQDVLQTGKMDYFDANFSLRFTYGTMLGYSETTNGEALQQPYCTRFSELSGLTLNGKPITSYLTPAEKVFCSEIEISKVFKDIPINVVSTTDITGGNSGSPVLNKDLCVVGTAFDSNWAGIVGDYTYDEASGRTVSVSLPFAVGYMNHDISGNTSDSSNRVTTELMLATTGKSFFAQ